MNAAVASERLSNKDMSLEDTRVTLQGSAHQVGLHVFAHQMLDNMQLNLEGLSLQSWVCVLEQHMPVAQVSAEAVSASSNFSKLFFVRHIIRISNHI